MRFGIYKRKETREVEIGRGRRQEGKEGQLIVGKAAIISSMF